MASNAMLFGDFQPLVAIGSRKVQQDIDLKK
jgi:hypothetical protein